MVKTTKINKDLIVKEERNENGTRISVIDGDMEVLLSDIETDDFYFSKWINDENYIVAYSRGSMANQMPLTIEGAYNIVNKKLLDVTNERTKELLEFMVVCKRGFSLFQILAEINLNDLGLLSKREQKELRNYFTSGNRNIDQEEVREYILSAYPQLRKYAELQDKLTLAKYHAIEEELGELTYWLHSISQNLDFNESVSTKKLKK